MLWTPVETTRICARKQTAMKLLCPRQKRCERLFPSFHLVKIATYIKSSTCDIWLPFIRTEETDGTVPDELRSFDASGVWI